MVPQEKITRSGLDRHEVLPVFINWILQTRDCDSGRLVLTPESIDARRVAVVVVDVWNYHWCKTAAMRVDAFVPRINKALAVARELGMPVFLCPSDVVDNYVGHPQREAVFNLPDIYVPAVVNVTCPPVPDAGGCACGAERCGVNYGWDGMHPGLVIGPDDWMPDTQAEVYALCVRYGLTHLVYMGFHTQVCLLGKSMGLRAMKSAGLECVLARDMTDAHPGYDPSRDFTPDLNTEMVVEHFEKYLSPTIHMQEELAKLGRWDAKWVVDPVRIAPWGTQARPHIFEHSITVTLSAPFHPRSEIFYTVDGSVPKLDSLRYTGPFEVTDTTAIRVSAFSGGKAVCLESEGYFARNGPIPALPDVYIGTLSPIRNVGFGHSYGGKVRYSGGTQQPQIDRSNLGKPIRINQCTYARGIGVHAPSELVYAIRSEFLSFVGLAGADANLLDFNLGSNLAQFPSIVFKVLIDGREAAVSPVMRFDTLAWRFDVQIPVGARRLSLVAMNGGNGSRENFADWADAGFTLRS